MFKKDKLGCSTLLRKKKSILVRSGPIHLPTYFTPYKKKGGNVRSILQFLATLSLLYSPDHCVEHVPSTYGFYYLIDERRKASRHQYTSFSPLDICHHSSYFYSESEFLIEICLEKCCWVTNRALRSLERWLHSLSTCAGKDFQQKVGLPLF